jgi:hypothetical protein
MNTLKPVRLHALKKGAVFLLKDFNSVSPASLQAANRLLQLPVFSGKTVQWMKDHAGSIQLKHAYQVLALEAGFNTWAALKQSVIQQDYLYRSAGVPYVHAWFKDYAAAEVYFLQHGGYLLCFWKDFIVCGKEYIRCLGLDSYEAYWQKTGGNWLKPQDQAAWQFLQQQAINNYLSQQ